MTSDDLITDIDITKRTESEWSDIYHLRLVNSTIEASSMDEFEWAYKITRSKYYLKPSKNNDYSIAEQMEMRALKISRDIFAHADASERRFLDAGKYISTKYVLDYKAVR